MCKITKKKELFEQMIKQVSNVMDLYSILRLIFPESDACRTAYGLKEHSLGRIFADLLMIPPAEKSRLLNWKDPQSGGGDFPSVLLSVIEPRLSLVPSGKMTVGDVDKFLSDLYIADLEGRKRLFGELINKAKPNELKWIIRILLKDMRLSIGIESIFRHLHPNAISLYHISNSLEYVLRVISGELVPSSIFFQPFKPMLSERVSPGDLEDKFPPSYEQELFLEPKLDGERMLVHIDKKRANPVSIFSRNSVDFSKQYEMDEFSTCFKGTGVVFDGEMVSWDTQKDRIHSFGKNRQFVVGSENTQKTDLTTDHMFYVVFDLVFYVDPDGKEYDLRNTPLGDRRELLERILLPVEHKIELIKYSICINLPDDISKYLKNALDNKDEGIIVKRTDSLYKLNVRGSGGWFKIKGDYDGVFTDTLDLVVLGGYFGHDEGFDDVPLNRVTSFLVGVPVDACTFKTVTKVGTGFTQNQLAFVRNKLRDSCVSASDNIAWLNAWNPSKANRPDIYFNPFINSVVLEVRASEITHTNEFSSGYQLRFPRILRPRTDKDLSSATSFEELVNMAKSDPSKNRIFIQRIGRLFGPKGTTAHVAKRRKAGGVSIILPPLAESHTNAITDSGDTMYVVNGEEAVKICKQLGAKIVHQYKPGVIPVAENADIRVLNLIQIAHEKVMNLDWLKECLKKGHLVTVNPETHVHIV